METDGGFFKVTFTRKEKDSVLRAKQRSHSYMTHLEDTEEWVPLAFSHLNSVETSEAITAYADIYTEWLIQRCDLSVVTAGKQLPIKEMELTKMI